MKNAFLIALLSIITVNEIFADGIEPTDNDSNGLREVSSLDHLLWISTNPSGLDFDYEQTGNIDASATLYWDDSDDDSDGNLYNDPNDLTADGNNEGWSPIGNDVTPFTGSYDGQDFIITGLSIDRPSNFQGLFGHTDLASITKLGLENGSVSGGTYTGGLAGIISNSLVSNCYSTLSVNGDTEVGGLVGRNIESDLENCYTSGNVNGYKRVGGLAGYSRDNSSISNCYSTGQINAATFSAGGLVGYNNTNSPIDSCYASGNVSANQYAGGLVGSNQSSTINKSYASGTVSGSQEIGGLTGYLWKGAITISYATGEVNASGYNAGGLVGSSYGISSVDNCYALGDVTRTSGSDTTFGAFIGYNHPSTPVSYCYSIGSVFYDGADNPGDNGFIGLDEGAVYYANYWDSQASNQTAATGANALTTMKMKIPITFTIGTWDFTGESINGDEDIWSMASGEQASYPFLSENEQDPAPGLIDISFAGGTGTLSHPYQVATLSDLYNVHYNLDAWYIQIADIDASETSLWDDGNGGDAEGWLPIGNYYTRFTGSYKGDMHVISGLTIYRPASDYLGLFGYAEGADIESLGVEDLEITGGMYVGGLLGYNYNNSSMSSCYTSGSIIGSQNVGGLVGWNETSSISECFAHVDVNGSRTNAGGLIGGNFNSGEVTNCYARGDVSRITDIFTSYGAFVGMNASTDISNCYATGSVFYNGATDPGGKGFAGTINSGTFSDNFWDSELSNQSTASGATGQTTANMKTQASYTAVDWDFMVETANGSNDYWGINLADNDGYPFLKWQGFKMHSEVTVWPTADILQCGQTLAEATLSGGSASVAGVFAFVAPGTVVSYGTTNYDVSFTPTDSENYAVISGQVSVIVEDNMDPEITSTHMDQTIDADAACKAALLDYTADVIASDNCDTDLTVTQAPVAGTIISGSSNSVSLTVTDDAGYMAEVTFNVMIEDNTDPSISCVEDQLFVADNSDVYTVSGTIFDPVSVSDNCTLASVENNLNSLSTLDGVEFPVGTTSVVWTAIDEEGNTATCSFDVTINSSTGINTLTKGDISILPNPAKNEIRLEFSGNSNEWDKVNITITDMSGKIMVTSSSEYIKEIETIDISNLERGLYLIRIFNHEGAMTRMFVKE